MGFGIHGVLEPVPSGYQGITIVKFWESQNIHTKYTYECSTTQESASQTPYYSRVNCIFFQIYNLSLQILKYYTIYQSITSYQSFLRMLIYKNLCFLNIL